MMPQPFEAIIARQKELATYLAAASSHHSAGTSFTNEARSDKVANQHHEAWKETF
jgi:hypothetical protein